MSDEKLKITRRGFVKGAGVLTGAAALLGDTLEASAAVGQARKLGPGAVQIELTVNGERHRLAVEPRTTLASALRDDLGLTGTKIGCDRGACGFCTPGMVMSCHALLQRTAHPSEAEVRQAVSGNLCRCGTYPKVFEAALAAASGRVVLAQQPEGSGATDSNSAANPKPAEGEQRTVAVGVLGAAVRREERKVPAGEPRPWDADARLSVVGRPTPRLEGPEKVTGRARFCYDVRLPGMLHAAMVRSPHAHARIRSVDVSAAEKMPGVKAAYVVERVLGPAELR